MAASTHRPAPRPAQAPADRVQGGRGTLHCHPAPTAAWAPRRPNSTYQLDAPTAKAPRAWTPTPSGCSQGPAPVNLSAPSEPTPQHQPDTNHGHRGHAHVGQAPTSSRPQTGPRSVCLRILTAGSSDTTAGPRGAARLQHGQSNQFTAGRTN